MNPRSWFTRIGKSPIMRMMFGSSVLRAASLGMTMLTSVALARLLGPTGLGYYSFALAVVTVVGLPIHMGLPTLVIRETARSEAHQDWARLRGLWSWAGRRIAVVSVITFLLIVPALLLFGDRMVSRGGITTVWISLALVPLIAIAQVRGAAVRGLHRPILGLLPDAIVRPASLLALLLAAWLAGTTISPENAMVMHIGAAIVASALGMVVLYRLTPPGVRVVRPDSGSKAEWKRALLPLALLAGTQVVMQNANILMLGFWETPDQVGYFKIAVSAANLCALGLTAIDMIIAPTFVRLYTKGQIGALQREAGKAALLAFGAALPLVGLFVVAGDFILETLYGASFIKSYAPLLVLLGGQLVNTFCGSCGHLLNMSGHERTSMRIMFIGMSLNMIMNIVLIPIFGIVGAAIATAASLATVNILLAFAIKAKIGISTTPFGLLRPYRPAKEL